MKLYEVTKDLYCKGIIGASALIMLTSDLYSKIPMKPAPTVEELASARANFKGAIYLDPSQPAEVRATDAVARMTFEEKKKFVTGFNTFFIAPLERLGLKPILFTDASAGVRINKAVLGNDKKSIAYPATIALTATWEPQLAQQYGAAIGAECRILGADVLLGPGVNLFRSSECGRNYEYMGEDPILAGIMATGHIKGIQSQGVMATGKHFLLNNHEWQRFASDIHVDERTINELYARAWFRMIHEGNVGAVMTSYNLVNGEKAGESKALVTDFLRDELAFDGLVMSDWGGVWQMLNAVKSGQDLVMPNGHVWVPAGEEKQIEQLVTEMSHRMLTQCFRFGLYDRKAPDTRFATNYPQYEKLALTVAQRAITLLKNKNGILPLQPASLNNVLITGAAAQKTPHGGKGSGQVSGYDHKHIVGELTNTLGKDKVHYAAKPTEEECKSADLAIICVNTNDHENGDRPFALENNQDELIKMVSKNQPNTIVVVISGGAIRMTDWNDSVAGVVHAYYSGQYGGTAITQVLTGAVTPSGKLPFTIEKEFSDSPAANDRPAGFDRTDGGKGWQKRDAIRVDYKEGIFIGYRWYDKNNTTVQYPFGHGLSYTSFGYKDLAVTTYKDTVTATVNVENTGKTAGAETIQIYYSDIKASVERPKKELCGFKKVDLQPGAFQLVSIEIPIQDFAFYDVTKKAWKVEAGEYKLLVGSSSSDIRVQKTFFIKKDMWFDMPVKN